MDFDLTEEQSILKDSLDRLLADNYGFEERKRAAADSLRKLHAPAQDDRIYHLKSTAQVMERARAILK